MRNLTTWLCIGNKKRIPVYEFLPAIGRYQYITIDVDAHTLRLDFRKFKTENHSWVLDGERGRDGKKVFDSFFL